LLRSWPHFYTRTRQTLAEAEHLLRRAIEIDPDYAPALAALATFQWITVSQGWMDRTDPAMTEMIRLAQAALAVEGNDPEILRLASRITALPGDDLAGGIVMINKSIGLNPNHSAGMEEAATLYAYAGDRQSDVTQLERSVRLNPVNRTLNFYFSYALIHFVAGEHDGVIEWTGKALQAAPIHAGSLRYRAASFGLLGRLEEGRQVVRQLLELVPDFTISRARRHIDVEMNNIFKTPGVAKSLYKGLRRSGIPE
jgi:adenylate cyclase